MHLIDQQLNLMLRGRFDEGWKLSEKMNELYPDDLRHKFNRGWFLINQGKLQEGFQHLECGRFLSVYGDSKPVTDKPIWDGKTDLTGKTVIINLEGGFGDQMIYARFATEVDKRGGTCIISCDPRLHSLFLRIPGTSQCITRVDIPKTRHDFWIPGFSCSWLFGHEFDTLPNEPYLSANPLSIDIWKNLIKSDKPKVGIRWSGSTVFEHQQFRIFPPELLIDLHKYNDGIQFYSLQRDTDTRELPDDIVDLQYLMISWDDTAAAFMNLDLVITSCTSIAHLASGLGIPTWVIVPMLPYHIWAYGDDHSPWYQPTTRVFRQKKFGRWEDTFEQVEEELCKRFKLEKK